VLVEGPNGADCLDISGYHAHDYFRDGGFLGPDIHGIVPVYRWSEKTHWPGMLWPKDVKPYP
jgi:hypothetical protein